MNRSFVALDRRDRWEDHALCRGLGPDRFFPAGDVGTAAKNVYDRAIAICSVCPVMQACLEFALRAEGTAGRKERSGVFGGLTPAQRHELATRRTTATQTGDVR